MGESSWGFLRGQKGQIVLEEIIYHITRSILAGNLPDTGALEMYFGSYPLVDEIVNGITRAIADQGDDDRLAALRDYQG